MNHAVSTASLWKSQTEASLFLPNDSWMPFQRGRSRRRFSILRAIPAQGAKPSPCPKYCRLPYGDWRGLPSSKLRATKQIPAVVYGAGKEPVSISIAEKDLIAVQKAGGNVIVEITLPTGTEQAIIKEVQYHVVKDTPIHMDYLKLDTL